MGLTGPAGALPTTNQLQLKVSQIITLSQKVLMGIDLI
jgi:hypothetical protein